MIVIAGEPLTFAEVLAANPDGVEHDSFQAGPSGQGRNARGTGTSQSEQFSETRGEPDKAAAENTAKM